MMKVTRLSLEGVTLLSPQIFSDDRGFFRETYRKPLYHNWGVDCDFVQDNHSYSQKGTLRGMHFQKKPGQAKLVTVIVGQIFDVVVDMRPMSPTFGKWEGVILDSQKGEQLFIPTGFAHGFCVLSDQAHVVYKCSSVYDPNEEKSFRFDDPEINIIWPIATPLLSERDRKAPLFSGVI